MLETLEQRLSQALEEKWEYSHFLEMLLSDEVERRVTLQLSCRLARSGLQPEKTLVRFDFSFNPTVHKPAIREFATCGFLEQHQCVFFVGNSGVGKSHLAQALGNEACLRGVDVLFRNTYELFKWIHAGYADGSHERRLAQVKTVELLILDDFGLRPLTDSQQADLYEVICSRYERHSMVITSNRDFSEWPEVFSNPLMGSAALDRLVHRAIRITIEGKSYRLSSFVESSKFLTNECKTSN